MTDLDNLDLTKLVVDLGTKEEILNQQHKDDAEAERQAEASDIDEDEEADYGRRD